MTDPVRSIWFRAGGLVFVPARSAHFFPSCFMEPRMSPIVTSWRRAAGAFTVCAALACIAPLAGCDDDADTELERDAQAAGQELEEAAGAVGEAAQTAGEKAAEAAEEGKQELGEAMEEAGENLQKADPDETDGR
jgi:hypothetical protein